MADAGAVFVEKAIRVDLHVNCAGLKRTLQITAVAALTIFFLALFLWNSNLRDVWRMLKATNAAWFVVAMFINWFALVFRALRWRLLIGGEDRPAFYPTFFATASGYMLSTVLPIRAGDVARPALLARRSNVRFATALGTVLTERVLDLISILSLFVYYCVRHWNDFPRHQTFIRSGATGGASTLVALFVFLIGLYFFRDVVRRAHDWLGRTIVPRRFREGWMKFFDSFAATLRITERPADLFGVVVCTAGIWICLTAQFWAVLFAAHRTLPFDASLFISGVTTVGIAIPTPGGVGGFHKVCQWVLTTFYGFDIDSSVALAVLFHIVGSVPVVITGLALFLREGIRLRDVTIDDAET
jgi:uncharacterized protein (TIRG00374 family)